MTQDWTGVFPAVTTQFKADQSLDLEASARHLDTLIAAGVHGLVMLGTLGENSALEPEEKRKVVRMAVETAAKRVPVVVGVAECSTAAACRVAADCEGLGADGLMVLPTMVYKTDARETVAHFRAVARASDLPIMVYNNPVSYGVDITPEMFVELADEPTLVALKESSDDVRRITDLVNLCGNRYTLFCGVDDLILESMLLGATGWVAGLVNAFPRESVRLWTLARAGNWEEARALYRWFMPLLHLDTHVKLVQYIKFAQAMAGLGTETLRAPRLPLEGEERARVAAIVERGLESRPRLAAE
ncbi:dihydrodipicolinate synthase family protein [Rhodospirillaceae bacterium SYSU D60014]|uniref:dihydrodipicolinate synthase family protein n=1 Tax=Virgifigura deserti TaxID=2268457 RepID=UPI000E66CC9B